jgi:hypothetical protein
LKKFGGQMEGEISTESIRHALAAWSSANLSGILSDVLLPEHSIQDASTAVQNAKEDLRLQTKEFRAKFQDSIPTDAGMALLSQYRDQLTKVRGLVKTNEAVIAKVFAGLAPMDDPVGLFRSIVSKLRTLPTFEVQLADLRSRAESARRGAEAVAALRDSLAQLRHECEDQVSVAVAAHSAAASDIDVSDFEEQKAAAEDPVQRLTLTIRGSA